MFPTVLDSLSQRGLTSSLCFFSMSPKTRKLLYGQQHIQLWPVKLAGLISPATYHTEVTLLCRPRESIDREPQRQQQDGGKQEKITTGCDCLPQKHFLANPEVRNDVIKFYSWRATTQEGRAQDSANTKSSSKSRIKELGDIKAQKPCWKNSSVTFSLHCLLSSHGRQGLQMSAHFSAICRTTERD